MKLITIIFSLIFIGGFLYYNKTKINKFEEEFESYVQKYVKLFNSPAEKEFRRKIFSESKKLIEEVNNQNLSYTLEINEYADIMLEELAENIKFNQENNFKTNENKVNKNYKYVEEFSWAQYDPNVLVNFRKFSGCYAYYAFSALDSIESRVYLDTKFKLSFSSQQLIDCVVNDKGNKYGCNGGSFINSWKFLFNNSLYQAREYPYIGRSDTCKYLKSNTIFKNIKEIIYLGKYNFRNTAEKIGYLQNMIIANPVSTYFILNNKIKLYKNGIFPLSECRNEQLNYSVSLTGFSNKFNYFILKNSLGKNWGENGFMRIQFNSNENINNHQCGILHNNASYPTLNY